MGMLNGGAAVKNCMTIPQKKKEKVNIELPSDLDSISGYIFKSKESKNLNR